MKELTKIKAIKKNMSQLFDESAKVVPYTDLELEEKSNAELFEKLEANTRIKITGFSKGRGFTCTVKRWNFRGGPRTHGQIKHRSPGSIGTQGQGRVMPGKKMPGRYGGEKVTYIGKFLSFDKDSNHIRI